MKRIAAALIMFFCPAWTGTGFLQAQELLTLEEAVAIGLENNHGIRLARNAAEVGHINRSLGGAGFLPALYVTGSRFHRDEIFRMEPEGESPARETLSTDFLAVDLALDWRIFDGLRMFTTYNRLTELRKLGEAEAAVLIENTVTDIIGAYYRIVREQQLLEILESSITMSEERVRIAETKRELGSGSEYEILLAQADLNADRAAAIRQEVIVNDSRLRLMHLLDLDQDVRFRVFEQIEPDGYLQMDDLLDNLDRGNREVQAAGIRTSVARLELNEIRKERLPEVDLNLGYGAFREESGNGFRLMEEQAGFHVGVTARLSLFDGFSNRRRSQIAHINRKNSEILLDETVKELEMLLRSEYELYKSAHRLAELENDNLILAERALEIAFEQFRLASITSVEFRETQRMLLETENRLLSALYEARLSEAELLRIAGMMELSF